jgi:hypothetical protein
VVGTPEATAKLAGLEQVGLPKPRETAAFDTPMAPHERAIALLHLGSEVEHALMVEYLYAAYSLDERQETEERRGLVKRWRAKILEIAREEMGHLASVQNVLTLIGGPLCFEREDYPIIDPDLWPFPFELERLTKDSLAKYVLTEAPSDEVLAKLQLTDEIEQIKERLKVKDDLTVNRVGALYSDILELFTAGPMIQGPIAPGVDHPFVATADIQAESLPFQVDPGAWGLGYKEILIEVASDRPSALAALSKVSIQGEGPLTVDDKHLPAELARSHFGKFLAIYREFPEQSEWSPSRPVATNPSTNPHVPDKSCRLVAGPAAPWAALANLRYRMLLLYLKHSFYIEAPSPSSTRSPRGALISWTFGEMYNLRSLSEILMGMPLQPGSSWMAGPPFELPYTLDLPARGANRWRTHRDLLMASIELIDKMLTLGHGPERYLRALRSADRTALDQVEVLIGA